jgi:hypothetical protein
VRLLHTLLALVLLAAALAAQDARVFQAAKDLPGYEAADLSEWSDLYGLAEFQAREGKPCSAAELEELRARWKAAVERARKRIAEIEADPRERAAWVLERKLARHGYFSKIAYTIERLEPGLVMVLQRPAKDEPGYAGRIASFYLPFVKKLSANFDALVAKPAELTRREGFELTAFAVLASKGDLDNFARFVQDPTGYTNGTCYDYQLQLAVTYEDPFASPSVIAQRSDLLYQLAKGLQHAHLAVPGNRPGSIWLYEGLAMLLALHEGTTAEALDQHVLRPSSIGCIVEILGREAFAPLLLFPADELAALRSWEEYRKAVDARVKRRAAEAPDRKLVGRAYFAQCELWAHYLQDGAQGAYRKPWTEFQKTAFRGTGGAAELQRAFEGLDLRSISRDFLRWVCAEHDRTQKDAKANTLPIDTLFDELPSAPAPAPAAPSAAAPAPAPAELVHASFAPAMLAPDAADAEAQLALALSDARAGDLEQARSSLAALAALAPAQPWPARIAREEARLAELALLRAAYLEYLRGSGGKLAFKHKGKDVMAAVTGVEGGLVKLGENKLGLPSVPLASLEPYEIAKVAAKKEMQGAAQPWARFYAYLIAGDTRWEKLLKDDSPAAAELRADAPGYAQLLRTAQTARELFELSRLPLPREASEAAARLERVQRLLAAGAGSALLERRIEALRQLARAALAAQSGAGGPSTFLRGKWTELGDGRGRLLYEFDDPAEGEDWVKVPGYLASERKGYPKLTHLEAQSSFAVEKGALRGVGSAFYRLALGFRGPLKLRYTFHYDEIRQAYPSPYMYWTLCDDGAGSGYYSSCNGQLHIEDVKHDESRTITPEDSQAFDFDKNWEIGFDFDGSKLDSTLQGAARSTMPAGRLARGFVGFLAHSELPIVFLRVEIEGLPDPDSLAQLREAWAARSLRALGFP